MKELPVKHVGIWIRVSTEDQARGESPEHHEKRARYYAESKGWKVIEVYHLEAVSGKSVMEHPETHRMLADIKTGHITGLIFSKLARLARNTKQLLEFADIFEKDHADLISLQEAIDTSTPAGRLFYTMIAAMAQWEREEIASRIAASIPIRAKLGKPLGGNSPLGYHWVDRKLVVNPQEAPIRKLVYELFLEHKRLKTVARLLNEKGYRTRKAGKFTDTTIHRLISDPSAKGIRRANYTTSKGPGRAWILKPQSEWVMNEIEPIVTEDLWNRCNAILEERVRNRKPIPKKAVHLFAGYVRCGVCGGEPKMYVFTNNPRKYACKCHNKIGTDDLEAIFHEQLKQFFLSSDEVTKYLGQADQVLKEKIELLASLESEQQKLSSQMDKMMKLYLSDEISKEGFGREFKPLEERRKQLEDQIPVLQGEIDFVKIKFQSSDEVLSQAKDLYANWPNLSREEKRNIIEHITEKILIGKGDVSIDLCYLPGSSEITANGQRNVMAALPFCRIRLQGEKPQNPAYPKALETLGDHMRKRRLDLGLRQPDVGQALGVDHATITNWELMHTFPDTRFLPKIYDFLGYCPVPHYKDRTLSKRIRLWRESLGLTQKQLARESSVDESALRHWETGRRRPMRRSKERLLNYLGGKFGCAVSF